MSASDPKPIGVLVVDDHPIVREGLHLLIETAEELQWLGEATDGLAAVAHCAEHSVDVVLMDLRMPHLDGIGAISRILAAHDSSSGRRPPAILVLTTFNEESDLLRALRAGARGCLLKDADRASLLAAIRTVATGGSVIPPPILERLLNQDLASPAPAPLRGDELSPREREVLAAAARGERSKEIAAHLGISERTVKAHLAGAYNKLGSDSRTSAVAEALRRGWLTK